MKLPGRVLFVGAHCDDIELFAGGLLAELCLEGQHQVGVLVFSDHRGVLDDAAAAQAQSEFRANLELLESETGARVLNHTGFMLPACRGAFEAERGRIYAAMEELRGDYDCVVTHQPLETNQDHAQVAREAQRVFKAHATLLGGEFPSNDLGQFVPQIYVELRKHALDLKVVMVDRYGSQKFGGRPYFDADAVRGLARVRGSQIRAGAAEAFTVSARAIVRAS